MNIKKARALGLCSISMLLLGVGGITKNNVTSTIDLIVNKYVPTEQSVVYRTNFENVPIEQLLYMYPELSTDSMFLVKRLNK